MDASTQAFALAIAVGSWLIGIAIGIIIGIRMPNRMTGWREAGGFAAMGLAAIGVVIVLFTIFGPGGPRN